jgi:1,4-dihydroxy-2-naphthoyl-CoA hydrolase
MNQEEILSRFNAMNANTLMEQLGIVFTKVEKGRMEATMPVDKRTHQPFGLLHGGANAAIAETLGSSGSGYLVDTTKFAVVGIGLNCNHIRGVKSGTVKAIAEIMHQGRSTHIWDINIYNEEGKVVSSCRLTNFIKSL